MVLLTNVPDIAAHSRFPARRIELGPKLNRRTVLLTILAMPIVALRLAAALRRERPVDVLLVHFKKEQLICSLLPPRLTGRVVWMEWGPVPPPMRKGLARRLYALAARRAHQIVAISEGTRKTIADAGVPVQKIAVVPNLVDVEKVGFDAAARARLRQEWGAGPDTFVIGCISRLQRRKRNDVIVDAALRLSGDFALVFAGEGEEEPRLRARAAPLGRRVIFVGSVRGQVEQFLSACDVLAFAPSPTEGEPRVIVMAQLVGVPVIATDSEGAKGLVLPGAGSIVRPGHDPEALHAALARYQADPARCRHEGALAREATRASHDPEQTLSRFEAALGA